jgi:2',3'-cyclic-nucleotide 2'-phosphodiesterase (5'-nucleotidase family)
MSRRFDEITPKAKMCKNNDQCIGGYARMVTVVNLLRKMRQDEKLNPLFLNAGDNFQGTTWYTLLHYNMTASLMNLNPPDAMTIGNHEFDGSPTELRLFLDAIRAPVLVANMNIKDEPSLKGKFKKSIVVQRDGRKIGIIGVIYDKTNVRRKLLRINLYNITFQNHTAHRQYGKSQVYKFFQGYCDRGQTPEGPRCQYHHCVVPLWFQRGLGNGQAN